MANKKQVVLIEFINDKCLETYPCKHELSFIDSNGKKCTQQFNGVDILSFIKSGLCQSSDIQNKHFAKYEEFLQENH